MKTEVDALGTAQNRSESAKHENMSALGPVFMFYAPGLFFGCIEGVGTRFNVLLFRTRFRRYRGRRVPFSCFALTDSFSAVPRALGAFFMFSAPRLVFGGTEGIRSHFHVLRSRNRFQRCRVRRVPFSCFVLPKSLSVVVRASGPVFIFCAPGIVIGESEGVGVQFSCFVLSDSFSSVPSASGPVFMFGAPRLIFVGTEGVRFRFNV
jgi:hypothetical protein